MTLKEIQNLIKFVAKSGATEIKLEMEDVKITIRTGCDHGRKETTCIQQTPVTPIIQSPAVVQPEADSIVPIKKEESPAEEESNYITVKSPIIGTFYRKASPDQPSFVEVGDTIKEGDVLCIIEAMKLFNEIESEVSGKIVKVLIDDSSPVEFDEPLFFVEPA